VTVTYALRGIEKAGEAEKAQGSRFPARKLSCQTSQCRSRSTMQESVIWRSSVTV
jgi:hypothetical protein